MSAVPGNHRWHSIQSTLKVNAATSNHSPLTPPIPWTTGKTHVDFIGALHPYQLIKSRREQPTLNGRNDHRIYDYLRVLFARVGTPHCLECAHRWAPKPQKPLSTKSSTYHHRPAILILAPIVSGRRGEYREHLEDALKAGFVRARIDGQIYDLPAEIQLDRNQRHTLKSSLIESLSNLIFAAVLQKRLKPRCVWERAA